MFGVMFGVMFGGMFGVMFGGGAVASGNGDNLVYNGGLVAIARTYELLCPNRLRGDKSEWFVPVSHTAGQVPCLSARTKEKYGCGCQSP